MKRIYIFIIFCFYGYVLTSNKSNNISSSTDSKELVSLKKESHSLLKNIVKPGWDSYRVGTPISFTELKSDQPVTSLALSKDSKSIFSTHSRPMLKFSNKFDIKYWDLVNNKSEQVDLNKNFTIRDSLELIAISPDGRYAYSAINNGEDDQIIKWNSTNNRASKIRGTKEAISSLAISSDGGKMLVSLYNTDEKDNKAHLFDLDNPRNTIRYFNGHTKPVSAVALTPDMKYAITGSIDKTAVIWDLNNKNNKFLLTEHTEPIRSIAVSPNSTLVATGSDDNTICIWDLKNKKLKAQLIGHKKPITSLAFSADGNFLLSGSKDKTAKLWNINDGTSIDLNGHKGTVTGVAITHDNKKVITGSEDKTIRIWDLDINKLLPKLEINKEFIDQNNWIFDYITLDQLKLIAKNLNPENIEKYKDNKLFKSLDPRLQEKITKFFYINKHVPSDLVPMITEY